MENLFKVIFSISFLVIFVILFLYFYKTYENFDISQTEINKMHNISKMNYKSVKNKINFDDETLKGYNLSMNPNLYNPNKFGVIRKESDSKIENNIPVANGYY